MQTAPVTSWADALLTSLAAGLALLFSAVPKILGFAVIIIIGWFIASAIAGAVTALLRAVHFNDVARRSGFSGFVEKMGIQRDASGFIADLVKWFIRLIVLVSAFDALGLPAVSQVLEQLLLWIPNLVVALVILVLAGLVANALGSLIRGATAEAKLGNPEVLATIARVAVWGFAIVIAVNQIGIATTLVNTLFMGLVGRWRWRLGWRSAWVVEKPLARSSRAGTRRAPMPRQSFSKPRSPRSAPRAVTRAARVTRAEITRAPTTQHA